jgi:hypothetical protein
MAFAAAVFSVICEICGLPFVGLPHLRFALLGLLLSQCSNASNDRSTRSVVTNARMAHDSVRTAIFCMTCVSAVARSLLHVTPPWMSPSPLHAELLGLLPASHIEKEPVSLVRGRARTEVGEVAEASSVDR